MCPEKRAESFVADREQLPKTVTESSRRAGPGVSESKERQQTGVRACAAERTDSMSHRGNWKFNARREGKIKLSF